MARAQPFKSTLQLEKEQRSQKVEPSISSLAAETSGTAKKIQASDDIRNPETRKRTHSKQVTIVKGKIMDAGLMRMLRSARSSACSSPSLKGSPRAASSRSSVDEEPSEIRGEHPSLLRLREEDSKCSTPDRESVGSEDCVEEEIEDEKGRAPAQDVDKMEHMEPLGDRVHNMDTLRKLHEQEMIATEEKRRKRISGGKLKESPRLRPRRQAPTFKESGEFSDALAKDPMIERGLPRRPKKGEAPLRIDEAEDSRYYIKARLSVLKPKDAMLSAVKEVYKGVEERYKKSLKAAEEKWEKDSDDVSAVLARLKRKPRANFKRPISDWADEIEPPVCDIDGTTGESLNECPVLLLPVVRFLPKMNHFSHVERSFRTEDRRMLSHVPYTKDHDETKFIQTLLEHYDEGIHGKKPNWGKIVNDRMFYELLLGMMDKFGQEPHERELVFNAINKLFPSKCSLRDLPNRYVKLCERFDGYPLLPDYHHAPLPELEANQFRRADPTDLDGFATTGAICSRCGRIACEQHDGDEMLPMEKKQDDGAKKAWEKANCGFLCHRRFRDRMMHRLDSISRQTQGLPPPPSAKRTKREHSNTPDGENGGSQSKKVVRRYKAVLEAPPDDWENPRLSDPFWTADEDLMFKYYMSMPGNSICTVTLLMNLPRAGNPYPCYKVYAYAQRHGMLDSEVEKKKTNVTYGEKQRRFRAHIWNTADGEVRNGGKLMPCTHTGPCGEQADPVCACHQGEVPCTKFCSCDVDCKNRFPGCRCPPGGCGTKSCQCFLGSWECDPELCKRCQCDVDVSVANVMDRPEEATTGFSCNNMPIQRGMQKMLLIAPSQIAGYGAYLDEDAGRGELIAEYTGEIISNDEAERRGQIYDKMKMSYTFELNNHETIDATYAGNSSRFINHSNYPNCFARVFIVNGEHRIGIFARRDIKKGEELFFNYNYTTAHSEKFTALDRPRAASLEPMEEAIRKEDKSTKSVQKGQLRGVKRKPESEKKSERKDCE